MKETGKLIPRVAFGKPYIICSVYLLPVSRCHGLSLPMNRVRTGQSSDLDRAIAEWQSASVTPQFNVSFSLVARVSKQFIAIES